MSAVQSSTTWLRSMVGAALALAVLATPVAAGDAARARLDQLRTLNETTRKWTDRIQRMRLTVVDRRGGEVQRELEVMTKRYGPDASRSIMFFHAPPMIQ